MNIKTKFGLMDKVWVIYHSKAVCATIANIKIEYGSSYKPIIKYYLKSLAVNIEDFAYDESECFSTKEELIASL